MLGGVVMRPRLERGEGAGELRFVQAEGRTRLAHLYQRAPCRLLVPDAEPGELLSLAQVTTSGGLAGGDRLDLMIGAGPGARGQVVGAAAEKIYRAVDEPCRIATRLEVGAGAYLEYLPQETILFEGARLARRIDIDIAPEGRLLAADMLVYGRQARGEEFTTGQMRDRWHLRRAGRLVWVEATDLLGSDLAFAQKAGLGGAKASASVLYVGKDGAAFLERARALVAEAWRAGVTWLDGLLLARWLDDDPQRLRRQVSDYLAAARGALLGLPAAVPRLWRC
ncbi:MAG: urease accessory protein UreD [Alphaproteobacteria bacterium]|nr:urease accessory protein UreD [Alphaproteobacteria bacterium]